MKCAYCGAELKVGCVYCSVCGKEAQIVSDYNLLEDDFLRGLLKEKKDKIQKKRRSENKKGKGAVSSNQKTGKKKKKPIGFLIMAVFLILVVGIVLLVNYSWNNSYDYQMKKAEDYQGRKDYQKAEKCLKRALELDGSSEDARLRLAEVYLQQEEYEKARIILLELLEEGEESREVCERLIQVYEAQEHYEAIEKLSREITDTEILELFEDYLAKPPVIEPEGGMYQEEIEVELTSEENCKIYYTLDGSDPREGKEYTKPILLEPGKNIWIRAVSCNKFGVYGEEEQERFMIKLTKPNAPHVVPSGGNFYGPQTITITVPEGCRVYYTWDGAEPTQESSQYTEPISMPEGNNVLSLILVDKYGMTSDVLKCNYVYIPQ